MTFFCTERSENNFYHVNYLFILYEELIPLKDSTSVIGPFKQYEIAQLAPGIFLIDILKAVSLGQHVAGDSNFYLIS